MRQPLQTLTLKTLYNEFKESFAQKSIKTASLDARVLIKNIMKLDDADFITWPEIVFSQKKLEELEAARQARCNNIPVSKILGVKEFWGLEFDTSENVLDPRPDSEVLVEAVLNQYNKDSSALFVDFGCGSGCIALSILHVRPKMRAILVDLSYEALTVAQANANKLGLIERVSFLNGSWADSLNMNFQFIVSNPPYIPTNVIPNLEPEVKNHDPILALDGGDLGLNPYKYFVPRLKKLLFDGGSAFFEIGQGQENDIARLVEKSGATLKASYRDIQGITRVLEISGGDK